MGLKDVLRNLSQAIDRVYERRIRAASLVKDYQIGGHGHSEKQTPHETAAAEQHSGQETPLETPSGEALVSDGTPH